MNEEEFLNKSISYLRREMEARDATVFEEDLESSSQERKELFSRLQESHSVMGDLVPMAESLKVGDFSPWEVPWLEFAQRHDIREENVGNRLTVLQTQTKYWRVAAIAALLVACISVGYVLKQGTQTQVAHAGNSLPTTSVLEHWNAGDGGTADVEAGSSLGAGEALVTGVGGRALLAFVSGVSVLAAEDTSVELESIDQSGSLRLKYGELLVQSSREYDIPIRSDMGNVVLKSPGLVRMIAGAGANGLWIGVAEGRVEFAHSGGTVQISEGQRFEVRGDSETLLLQTQKLTEEELEEIRSMAQIDF